MVSWSVIGQGAAVCHRFHVETKKKCWVYAENYRLRVTFEGFFNVEVLRNSQSDGKEA